MRSDPQLPELSTPGPGVVGGRRRSWRHGGPAAARRADAWRGVAGRRGGPAAAAVACADAAAGRRGGVRAGAARPLRPRAGADPAAVPAAAAVRDGPAHVVGVVPGAVAQHRVPRRRAGGRRRSPRWRARPRCWCRGSGSPPPSRSVRWWRRPTRWPSRPWPGRCGCPRRLLSVLQSEGLFNDATALVVFQTAVLATVRAARSRHPRWCSRSCSGRWGPSRSASWWRPSPGGSRRGSPTRPAAAR